MTMAWRRQRKSNIITSMSTYPPPAAWRGRKRGVASGRKTVDYLWKTLSPSMARGAASSWRAYLICFGVPCAPSLGVAAWLVPVAHHARGNKQLSLSLWRRRRAPHDAWRRQQHDARVALASIWRRYGAVAAYVPRARRDAVGAYGVITTARISRAATRGAVTAAYGARNKRWAARHRAGAPGDAICCWHQLSNK